MKFDLTRISLLIALVFALGVIDGCKKDDDDDNDDMATCTDGIQNGNESGVDCGGDCPACETCSDGIMNQDEEGVDCGGSCPTPCEESLTATLNDIAFEATFINANTIGTSIFLSAGEAASGAGVNFVVNANNTAGTYTFNGSDITANFQTSTDLDSLYNESVAGSITFTVFDTVTKKVSGTFSFTAENESGALGSAENGVFVNVEYN